MVRENSNLSQCQGKNTFETATLALDVARRSRRSHDGERLSAYKCPLCKKWHVGTVSKKPRGHRSEKHD